MFPVSSPPLRERADDIPILAEFFLKRSAQKLGVRPVPRLTKGQARELSRYPWPGNVRELENTIERALILAAARRGQREFGLPLVAAKPAELCTMAIGSDQSPPWVDREVVDKLKGVEYQTILSALKATGWRVHGPGRAAVRLGINPFTLTSRIKRLGLARHSEAHLAFLRE